MAHVLKNEDFTSDRIRQKIDERYLELADERYLEILAEYNIAEDETPDTVSPKTKRVLVLFVSVWVCRDRMGISLGQSVDGVQEDPWEKMYNAYMKDYQDALLGLTRENILGESPDVAGMTGRIYRGG